MYKLSRVHVYVKVQDKFAKSDRTRTATHEAKRVGRETGKLLFFIDQVSIKN